MKSSKISLYIHIPFCSSKCKYCDFYSETSSFNRISGFITQIINQLEYHYHKLGKPGIETVFIGGGTPSILPKDDLVRLLSYVKSISGKPKEWTVESNPESIDRDFLLKCMEFGVTRLSVGVQSFNNNLLNLLGRGAKIDDVNKAFNLIKKLWKGELNLDLISSIPGQNREILESDIKRALEIKPDHISFYALSLEEGTALEDEVSKGILEDLSPKESEDIWFRGKELLLDRGYKNYEVSNYTKSSPCKHNINYWELKPYLGIGPGAVSTLINNKNEIVRISCEKSITKYLQGEGSSWGESVEIISPKEFLKDYIIMGLRLKKGIDKERFKLIFNSDIDKIISTTPGLVDDNLIYNGRDFYSLTEKGYDIMNTVVVDILEAIEDFNIERINWFY